MNDEAAVRLVKYLSAAGVASRRGAGDLVKAGRVKVNGVVVWEPGLPVLPSDRVMLDDVPVGAPEKKHYIMLHKPRNYTCSNHDVHADHLAVELIDLPEPVRLFSAGRLDRDSEGLILFSNDGDFVAHLTHPRNGILKCYDVRTAPALSEEALHKITSGIRDEGDLLRALRAEQRGNGWCRLVLGEGKKREIRRMVAACGAKTLRLKRLAIGRLQLGDLPLGTWRELTPAEVDAALAPVSPEEMITLL